MKKFLALGDSFTIGEAVGEQERWPALLVRALREDGTAIDDPEIIATTGWTTGELLAGIEAAGIHPPYDLVSLLIGVNNQYRGGSLSEYESEFKQLLKLAENFAGGDRRRVLVVSIPDWGMTPYADKDPRSGETIRDQVAAFNAANRQITERAGIRYADVFPISQQAYDVPGLIAADGLHPSGEQYARWLDVILPAARSLLRES